MAQENDASQRAWQLIEIAAKLALRSAIPGVLATLAVIEIIGPISHALEFSLPIRLMMSAFLLASAIAMALHERHQEMRIRHLRSATAGIALVANKIFSRSIGPSQILEAMTQTLSHERKPVVRFTAALFLINSPPSESRLISTVHTDGIPANVLIEMTDKITSILCVDPSGILCIPSTRADVGTLIRYSGRDYEQTILPRVDVSSVRANAPNLKSIFWATARSSKEVDAEAAVVLMLASDREFGSDIDIVSAMKIWLMMISETL